MIEKTLFEYNGLDFAFVINAQVTKQEVVLHFPRMLAVKSCVNSMHVRRDVVCRMTSGHTFSYHVTPRSGCDTLIAELQSWGGLLLQMFDIKWNEPEGFSSIQNVDTRG